MHSLSRVLEFVRKNLAYLVLIFLAAGILKGHWWPMPYSRIICLSALLVMIFPVFINLEIEKGIREFRGSIRPASVAALVSFLLYPVVAFALGWLFLRGRPAMWLGLVLLSLVPTSGMTINWTYFTKGNMHAAMAIVSSGILGAVLVLPFEVPAFTSAIIGEAGVEVDKEVIIEKLFFVIVLPVIFGYIARMLIVRYKGYEFFRQLKPINSGISACGVLLVSFLVMSLESTQAIVEDLPALPLVFVPVALFYAIIFLVGHFLGRWLFPVDVAKAFFFGTAARYHVITLGVVLGTFRESPLLGYIVIPVAVGLAVQIPALAFYARWLQRLEMAAETMVGAAKWVCRHCGCVLHTDPLPTCCPECGRCGDWYEQPALAAAPAK